MRARVLSVSQRRQSGILSEIICVIRLLNFNSFRRSLIKALLFAYYFRQNRDIMTMRYVNLLFTYLPTYLFTVYVFIAL